MLVGLSRAHLNDLWIRFAANWVEWFKDDSELCGGYDRMHARLDQARL